MLVFTKRNGHPKRAAQTETIRYRIKGKVNKSSVTTLTTRRQGCLACFHRGYRKSQTSCSNRNNPIQNQR
ncbi:hypothetical protein J6590_008931 [Homalodisca vitripennis]|nr:hypothetical protein J6590_008931 [Homalodisca vitripennis]